MTKLFYGPDGITNLLLATRRRLEGHPELAYYVRAKGFNEHGTELISLLLSKIRNRTLDSFSFSDSEGSEQQIVVNYYQSNRASR